MPKVGARPKGVSRTHGWSEPRKEGTGAAPAPGKRWVPEERKRMHAPKRGSAASPGHAWRVVGMLWLICFFNYADRQAIFAIFPVLKQQFGFTTEQLGLIGAAFTLVYALTAPAAGSVGDRFSRRILVLGGLGIWSAVTGCTALCSRVWQFIVVRGAEALGETFYFPASMSLISDYHGRATRSRALSLHQTSVYAGTIGGGTVAGWLAQRWGWRSPFLLLAAAGLLLAAILAFRLRELPRGAADPEAHSEPVERPGLGAGLRECARVPTALLLAAGFFGANLVALVFLSWMPTFLKEKFGLDLAAAAFGGTVFIQVASMVGAALGGAAADRWRARWSGGRIAVQALGALAGAPCIFFCGWTRSLGSLAVAMTLFGLFKGVYDSNIWAALFDVVPVSRRGTVVGWMNMVGWLGGALGVFGVGAAVQRGVSMSAAIASTATLYLGVSALLLAAAIFFAPADVKRLQA